MGYQEEYTRWLEEADAETVSELRAVTDEGEKRDRFYRNLAFGTAGLRGVIGAGTNRMNTYIVGQATQGLANQLIKTNGNAQACSVVIAYDSRHQSDVFAKKAACVLAANGIRAYLFAELKPVPLLSFAVRHCEATAGIAVTASHNPAKYNGYKVYGGDGAQLSPALAGIVLEEMEKTDPFRDVQEMDFDTAVRAGAIVMLGEEMEEAYLDRVEAQSLRPRLCREKGKNLHFVYTPFHGTGNQPVRKILRRLGFENVTVVKEQELPDGDFPTVESPNPENKEGFRLAVRYARDCGADLIVGTDPDADRVGILVRAEDGEYVPFTGNQVGALLTEYILSSLQEAGNLPEDGYVVKTIVTTDIVRAICKHYGVELKEVLTGFKFIGEKIRASEETGKGTYLFGFEESYGYLKGTYARDKDAVVAAMLIAEMALYYQEQGSSLFQQMERLYQTYGHHLEYVTAITLEGESGLKKMQAVMAGLRTRPPKQLMGKDVLAVQDYQTSLRRTREGAEEVIHLPKSDVLCFELAGDNRFIVRPSGTEPKIKVYCLLKGDSAEAVQALAREAEVDIEAICKE